MYNINWHEPGTRLYNAGVDRGVLYVPGQDGVAWSGLISVAESPEGGERQTYYMDGVRYLNLSGREDFRATLSAFYSPPEFDQCDGLAEIVPGYSATQQVRKPFGLAYRTPIGNDISENHGYKLHLVYNALAAPSSKVYSTKDESADVDPLVWDLSTTPINYPGISPTAHFEIDTTTSPAWLVRQVEFILYGYGMVPAKLPFPEDIFQIVQLGPGTYDQSAYHRDFYN